MSNKYLEKIASPSWVRNDPKVVKALKLAFDKKQTDAIKGGVRLTGPLKFRGQLVSNENANALSKIRHESNIKGLKTRGLEVEKNTKSLTRGGPKGKLPG